MSFNKIHALQEAQRTLAQGKLSQAIREYLTIIEEVPAAGAGVPSSEERPVEGLPAEPGAAAVCRLPSKPLRR